MVHKKNQTKKVAHLNGIRAFEATARHKSFAAAAQELNVTPAAVGQQVRQLEEWLGVSLFDRSLTGSARLTMTEQAQQVYPDIQRGLALILQSINQLRAETNETQITVSASPSITAKWLIPLVQEYQTCESASDIQIETDLALVDYLEQGIDIGIRYGEGRWDGLNASLLMTEDIFPVCSPDFVLKHRLQDMDLNDFSSIPLIYDRSAPKSLGYPSWQMWAKALNLSFLDKSAAMSVNDFSSVLELARGGNGLALARSRLVEKELAAGELVCPFGLDKSKVSSQFSYFLVWPENQDSQMKTHHFRHWILAQAKRFN